jgi:hypothetical protein
MSLPACLPERCAGLADDLGVLVGERAAQKSQQSAK